MKCLFKIFFLSFLCLSVTYKANAQQAVPAKPIKLVYDLYNKDLHVVTVDATYTLTNDSYQVKAHFSSPSLVSLFFNLDTYSSVSGGFKDNHALPDVFESTGKIKKNKFHTVIDFNHGQNTVIKTLEPAIDNNRDPLTNAQIQNSLDIMSAMADLIYRVRATGKCDDQFNLLDGMRSFTFKSQTIGDADIPSTWSSPYRGKASLCHAVAQQVGGLKHSRNRALMAQPQPGSLWFKNIDGVGMLPVRFEFKHPKMGMIIAIFKNRSR